MSSKVYVVTLYRREDLPNFYAEMAKKNIRLEKKRPISRNTSYYLTEEQASELREDPRVWGVEAQEDFKIKPCVVNREPYGKSGTFWKADTQGQSTISPNDLQWGHIHCAGNDGQRGKNNFGPINLGWNYEKTSDTIEVFNSGRHVDVVIVDDPVSFDSEEWYSQSTNKTRFVEYQWLNELNTLVNSIDDDAQSEPTGSITYHENSSMSNYHGNHVTGTVAGQHYGWAREANIYNLAVTDPWASGQSIPALLIFDYLRAFHRTKGINQETGKKNPTISNHSYGGIRYMPNEQNLTFGDLISVTFRGVQYDSGNPGPSGWNQSGVEDDFGIRFNLSEYPTYSASIAADVQDAIAEGIVVVGAAGNDNLLVAQVGDQDWDNVMQVNGAGTFFYNRGAWPNTPDSGAINVGALNKQADFRRSTYTQFGPGISLFAPGDNIVSAYGNGGLSDNKYSQGSGNYFYPIQGTSMASPQVCGVLACLATGKDRFNQEQAIAYIEKFSKDGDMTFNLSGGSLGDNTCSFGSPDKYLLAQSPREIVGYIKDVDGRRKIGGQTYPRSHRLFSEPPTSQSMNITFTVVTSGSSHYVLTGTDRVNTFNDAQDPTIRCNARDKIVFSLNTSGHPFLIKTAATIGTGDQLITYSGSGYGVLRNDSIDGDVTLYTEGLAGTTLYYVCKFHSSMQGQIIIS